MLAVSQQLKIWIYAAFYNDKLRLLSHSNFFVLPQIPAFDKTLHFIHFFIFVYCIFTHHGSVRCHASHTVLN